MLPDILYSITFYTIPALRTFVLREQQHVDEDEYGEGFTPRRKHASSLL